MAATASLDGVPLWTERMYRPGGGQDHLGLGSVVTERILPRLSPSINVQTVRPRYWSFYSFVLSEFWRRDLPRTRVSLREWYRPLEFVYSVACSLCDHEEHRGSPVGSRRVDALLATEPQAFDPKYHYIDSPLGGYGLYYGTVMQSLGLVVLAHPKLGLPVDAVTPAGQVVADSFRSEIADTRYFREWIDRHDDHVPREVVEEYAEHACLCRLRDETAADRPLLADAFLHHGDPADAAARRETLRMVCELAEQTAAWPISADSFRRLIYYRADYGDDEYEGPSFEPGEGLRRVARRWRLYQAREYFNAALNEMWRRLTCWGIQREGDLYPVPMSEVLGSIAEIDFEAFARDLDVDLPPGGIGSDTPFADLLAWITTTGWVSGELDDPWDLDAPLTEDRIIEWLEYGQGSDDAGADVLAAALTLLTLVAARVWQPELALVEPADWFPVLEGQRQRLGMQRFLGDLRRRVEEDESVGAVTAWLTLDYVIAQHERVANAKLTTTGDTFRFRREAGRLRFFDKETRVGMNNSRYTANATVTYELGWTGYLYEEDHGVTEEGELFRRTGDLPQTGAFE